jgi:hypothetical protein
MTIVLAQTLRQRIRKIASVRKLVELTGRCARAQLVRDLHGSLRIEEVRFHELGDRLHVGSRIGERTRDRNACEHDE